MGLIGAAVQITDTDRTLTGFITGVDDTRHETWPVVAQVSLLPFSSGVWCAIFQRHDGQAWRLGAFSPTEGVMHLLDDKVNVIPKKGSGHGSELQSGNGNQEAR
jgi:hypothetical protein